MSDQARPAKPTVIRIPVTITLTAEQVREYSSDYALDPADAIADYREHVIAEMRATLGQCHLIRDFAALSLGTAG